MNAARNWNDLIDRGELALDANSTWAITMRGEIYRCLHRYNDALADFTRAISLDEKYAWFIAMRGEVYRQMGKYELSLADFDRALALKPNEDWVVERRAQTDQQLRKERQTTQALQPAIQPVGKRARGAKTFAWLVLALVVLLVILGTVALVLWKVHHP